ncbi:hypothetical protein [Sinomonas susongensis]|uniref:hypothetical protein n=1 Tax=Sinomonas susongensis TaxID=1324851 RepID=UPI001109281A|nr:hypothetical protein [Sinomonas susongensis]
MTELMSRLPLGGAASRAVSPSAALAGERVDEAEELREVAQLALAMALRRYREGAENSPKACA